MLKGFESQKVVGIIPARMGSTRFPGKMLAKLGEKTLLQQTYDNALRCPYFTEVAIATDDVSIADHARSFGAKVFMTPESCPSGSDRIAAALHQAPEYADVRWIVNIQGDEPFVAVETFTRLVEAAQKNPDAAVTTAVVPLVEEEEIASPHVVKCVFDAQQRALYFSRAAIPYLRQEQTIVYGHLGLYCFRHDFLLRYATLPSTPLQQAESLEQLKILEHGYAIQVAIVEDRALGIDTPEDLEKAQRLWNENTYSSLAGLSPR